MPGYGGGAPGDLYLEVRIAPHKLYRVEGNDVYMTLPVTPTEAALGAQVRSTHAGRRRCGGHRAAQCAQWTQAAPEKPGPAGPRCRPSVFCCWRLPATSGYRGSAQSLRATGRGGTLQSAATSWCLRSRAMSSMTVISAEAISSDHLLRCKTWRTPAGADTGWVFQLVGGHSG